jgi:fructokinase
MGTTEPIDCDGPALNHGGTCGDTATVTGMGGPIVVVGEVIADLIGTGGPADLVSRSGGDFALNLAVRPGGSPANVAVGLARLGIAVEFAGRVSGRGLGPWLRKHLVDNGVGLRHTVVAAEMPTLAFVGLDPAGVPTYGFYGPTTADWNWKRSELPDCTSSAASALHTGSLATALPPGADVLAGWVDGLRADGQVLVSYDPNVRPSLIPDLEAFAQRVEGWVRRSHLVKVSEEDLDVLVPGRPALDVAAQWATWGPELVVVTQAEDGATALRPDGFTLHRPGRSIEVVDTVGAGDAFAAGLLAWLSSAGALHPGGPAGLGAGELVAALDQAIEVATITCTRPGADPPYARQLPGVVA